jgi:hypothetical protein
MKRMDKMITILLVILVVAVLSITAIIIFNRDTYKSPIKKLYESINEKNVEKLASTYHPCLSKNEAFKTELESQLAPIKDYDYKYEYSIKSSRSLSKKELEEYKNNYKHECKIDVEKGYEVEVSQTTIVNKEKSTDNKKILVGFIDGKWYLIK